MASCPTCGKSKRSKTHNTEECAPRMSDGRMFTDFRPRCTTQFALFDQNKEQIGSYKLRQFMINKADTLIQNDRKTAEKAAHCDCYPKNSLGTQLPHAVTQKCNKNTCTFLPDNKQGLGLKRS